MWNTEGFSPSISQAVKNNYEGELKNLEAERNIVKPTEQELLWARQHAQWLYDKSEIHDMSDMLPTLLRIQSMKTCFKLRLRQDGKIQSIEGTNNGKGTGMGNQMRRSSFLLTRNTMHHSYVPRRLTRRNGRSGALRAFDSATSRSLLRYRT